jgi:hypothetical protein
MATIVKGGTFLSSHDVRHQKSPRQSVRQRYTFRGFSQQPSCFSRHLVLDHHTPLPTCPHSRSSNPLKAHNVAIHSLYYRSFKPRYWSSRPCYEHWNRSLGHTHGGALPNICPAYFTLTGFLSKREPGLELYTYLRYRRWHGI